MKIYFRKTFEYNPIHSGLSKYESYEAVTRQNRSPDIVVLKSSEYFSLPAYCSSLKRCKHTAEIFTSGKVTALDELREVKFSLHNLVTSKEFEKYGPSLVRERFIQSFINDSLLEKRSVIKKRIDKAIIILFHSTDDKLVVSHSFTMKMFEAYLKNRLDIFKNPNLISKVIRIETETFAFGKGFEVEINKL